MRPRSSAGARGAAPLRAARALPAARALLAALAALALLGAGGCSLKYAEGQGLEQQGRWEEALLAYRDAVIDHPDDPDYLAALERANKVVARDNFERYKAYLADKAFRKAHDRLMDAARQDPAYPPVREELAKWERVLVAGQVAFRFETSKSDVSLAEEIRLIVRINTPNPGETIDAPVDIDNGTFFAEDLLYNRPNELLTLYSINAIGVDLVFGRTRIKQFTSRQFDRFINIRTPVVDHLSGTLALLPADGQRPIGPQRGALPEVPIPTTFEPPGSNPHYTLNIQGDRILVGAPAGGRTDFTPRFLYLNRQDRRVFVDFGRYEVRLADRGERWNLRRLPLLGNDYFPHLARDIALQPYFFYREGVFTYVPARPG